MNIPNCDHKELGGFEDNLGAFNTNTLNNTMVMKLLSKEINQSASCNMLWNIE